MKMNLVYSEIGKKKKYSCIKSHYPSNISESLAEFEYNENWKEIFN